MSDTSQPAESDEGSRATAPAGVDLGWLLTTYMAIGRSADDLPYTAPFERLYDSVCDLFGGNTPTRQAVWLTLRALRRAGKLPRVCNAASKPPEVSEEERRWWTEHLGAGIGQRHGLPYSERFDRLVDDFNRGRQRPLLPCQAWRLVIALESAPTDLQGASTGDDLYAPSTVSAAVDWTQWNTMWPQLSFFQRACEAFPWALHKCDELNEGKRRVLINRPYDDESVKKYAANYNRVVSAIEDMAVIICAEGKRLGVDTSAVAKCAAETLTWDDDVDRTIRRLLFAAKVETFSAQSAGAAALPESEKPAMTAMPTCPSDGDTAGGTAPTGRSFRISLDGWWTYAAEIAEREWMKTNLDVPEGAKVWWAGDKERHYGVVKREHGAKCLEYGYELLAEARQFQIQCPSLDQLLPIIEHDRLTYETLAKIETLWCNAKTESERLDHERRIQVGTAFVADDAPVHSESLPSITTPVAAPLAPSVPAPAEQLPSAMDKVAVPNINPLAIDELRTLVDDYSALRYLLERGPRSSADEYVRGAHAIGRICALSARLAAAGRLVGQDTNAIKDLDVMMEDCFVCIEERGDSHDFLVVVKKALDAARRIVFCLNVESEIPRILGSGSPDPTPVLAGKPSQSTAPAVPVKPATITAPADPTTINAPEPADHSQEETPNVRDLHADALEAMLTLKAVNRDSRKSAKDIAKAAVGAADENKVKEPLADLARWGYAGSLQGRKGGSWITQQGKRALRTYRTEGNR